MTRSWRLRLMMFTLLGAGLVIFLSCQEPGPIGGDGGGDVDGDADVDIDVDIDVDADSDIDADSDSDGDPTPFLAATAAASEQQIDTGVFANSLSMTFGVVGGATCGITREAFGAECEITTIESPLCVDECGEGLVCTWDAACLPVCLPPSAPYQAGVITITGATHQPTITCTFSDETGAYSCDLVGNTDFWEASDTLRVQGAGGTFPAFEGELQAPSDVVVLTELAALTPDRFAGVEDLHLEWFPGTGTVGVSITAMAGGAFLSLSCTTDDDGAIDVPAAGLLALASIGDTTSWTLNMTRGVINIINEGVEGQVTLYAVSTTVSETIIAE